MLPVKTLDTLTASAYLRAGISSGEGGTLIEESRVNNKRERTEAYGAAFLGLTVGCANCHDHKFDPITQKDFYRLTAFFNNLTEIPSNDDRNDWPPFLRLPKIENRDVYEQVLAKRSELERQRALRREQAQKLIAAWIGQSERTAIAVPVSSEGLAVRLRFDEQKGSTFVNSAPGVSQKHFSATGAPVVWGEGTWFWPYMRMEISTKLELPNAGGVEANQAFSVGTWLRPNLRPLESKDEEKPAGVILSAADAGQKLGGWQLRLSKGKLGFVLAHEMPDNAIQVETKQRVLVEGRWNHVLATHDGSGKAAGVTLYVDDNRRRWPSARIRYREARIAARLWSLAACIRTLIHCANLPSRTSGSSNAHSRRRKQRAFLSRIMWRRSFRKPMSGWSEDEFHTVSEFYFAQRDEATQKLNAQIAPLNEELDRLSKDGPITLVSEEGRGCPTQTYLLVERSGRERSA